MPLVSLSSIRSLSLFALWRFCFGVYLMYEAGQLYFHRVELFQENGLVASLKSQSSVFALNAILIGAFVSATLFTFGKFRRTSAIFMLLSWAWLTSLHLDVYLYPPTQGYVGWMLLVAAAAPKDKSAHGISSEPLSGPAIHATWIVLGVSLSLSGLDKLGLYSWLSGNGVSELLETGLVADSAFARAISSASGSFKVVLSWGVLWLECFGIFLCVFPSMRPLTWLALTIFHLSILLTLQIDSVPFAMLLLQLLLFDKKWLNRDFGISWQLHIWKIARPALPFAGIFLAHTIWALSEPKLAAAQLSRSASKWSAAPRTFEPGPVRAFCIGRPHTTHFDIEGRVVLNRRIFSKDGLSETEKISAIHAQVRAALENANLFGVALDASQIEILSEQTRSYALELSLRESVGKLKSSTRASDSALEILYRMALDVPRCLDVGDEPMPVTLRGPIDPLTYSKVTLTSNQVPLVTLSMRATERGGSNWQEVFDGISESLSKDDPLEILFLVNAGSLENQNELYKALKALPQAFQISQVKSDSFPSHSYAYFDALKRFSGLAEQARYGLHGASPEQVFAEGYLRRSNRRVRVTFIYSPESKFLSLVTAPSKVDLFFVFSDKQINFESLEGLLRSDTHASKPSGVILAYPFSHQHSRRRHLGKWLITSASSTVRASTFFDSLISEIDRALSDDRQMVNFSYRMVSGEFLVAERLPSPEIEE